MRRKTTLHRHVKTIPTQNMNVFTLFSWIWVEGNMWLASTVTAFHLGSYCFHYWFHSRQLARHMAHGT